MPHGRMEPRTPLGEVGIAIRAALRWRLSRHSPRLGGPTLNATHFAHRVRPHGCGKRLVDPALLVERTANPAIATRLNVMRRVDDLMDCEGGAVRVVADEIRRRFNEGIVPPRDPQSPERNP